MPFLLLFLDDVICIVLSIDCVSHQGAIVRGVLTVQWTYWWIVVEKWPILTPDGIQFNQFEDGLDIVITVVYNHNFLEQLFNLLPIDDHWKTRALSHHTITTVTLTFWTFTFTFIITLRQLLVVWLSNLTFFRWWFLVVFDLLSHQLTALNHLWLFYWLFCLCFLPLSSFVCFLSKVNEIPSIRSLFIKNRLFCMIWCTKSQSIDPF